MAKIKFGMMMTDASGKLGGQVFSKNRGGSYVRTKVTPTNAQTTAQMNVRGAFASISSTWSSLLEEQRTSFNQSVSAYGRTDIFGDIRNPSGKALFQRLNQNLAISEQVLLDSCPQPAEVPFSQLDIAQGSVTSSSFDVEYSGDLVGCKVLVFATPPLSQGTSFVKNKLRLIAVQTGSNSGSFDIYNKYQAKFGSISEGANIHIALRVVNANGQASPLEVAKATIVG